MNNQGYYLDEWLICALNQVKFGTYVSDTNFHILRNATSLSATNQHSSKWYPRLMKSLTWLGDLLHVLKN